MVRCSYALQSTLYQTISYPKICPDRQLTYPDFPELVRIPALAAPQNPANPVRIAPRCRSKNLKSCPDWDLAVSPIAQGPTIVVCRCRRRRHLLL